MAKRHLRGIKPAISDALEDIKAVISEVMNPTWQRCRVQFMRNIAADAAKAQWRRSASDLNATDCLRVAPEV